MRNKLPFWVVLILVIPWSLVFLLLAKVCGADEDYTRRTGSTADSYKVSSLGSTPRPRTRHCRHYHCKKWKRILKRRTNLPICKGKPCDNTVKDNQTVNP